MNSVITVYPSTMRDAWMVQIALGLLNIREQHFDTLESAAAMMTGSNGRKLPRTIVVDEQSIIQSNRDGSQFSLTCQRLGISILGLVRDGQKIALPWGEPIYISNLHLRLDSRK